MDNLFRFKQFSMHNSRAAMKIGTDGVLLGAAMTLKKEDRKLLDVGTGTGVVSMLAACRLDEAGADWRISALDTDPESVEEAALNFRESPWGGRMEARLLPLQEFGPESKFDCIFSNPPYYDCSLTNPDEREKNARHSCTLSYRDICEFARAYLSTCGRLSLILPSELETILRRTAVSYGLYPFRTVRIRTAAGKKPARILAEFCKEAAGNVSEEEIHVKDNPYTNKFYL